MKIKEKWKKAKEKQNVKDIEQCKRHPMGWRLMMGVCTLAFAFLIIVMTVGGAYPLAVIAAVFWIWQERECLKIYKKAFPKGKFFALGLILLIATVTIATGSVTNLATMEYEDTEIIATTGNVTLEYDSSDTGTEDVLLIWRIYSQENDMTLYCIKSQEILYDHTFVNDTKNYTFYDNTDEYSIQVDYSSIIVPEGWEAILNETIAEKDAVITNLTAEKKNLTELIERMNNTIITLVNERDLYKQQRDDEVEDNAPLRTEIDRLTLDVYKWRNKSGNLSGDVNDLEHENKELNDTINARNTRIWQKEDIWCSDFKFPSFLIGVFFVGMFVICWKVKKNWKPKKPVKKEDSKISHTKKGMPDGLNALKKKEEEIEAAIAEKKRQDETKEEETEDNLPVFEPVDEEKDKTEKKKEEVKTEKKTEKTEKKATTDMYAFVDSYKPEKIGVEFA